MPRGRPRYIEFNGEKKRLPEWAEEYGIKYNTLKYRIDNLGWSMERALTTPVNDYRELELEYDGEKKSLRGWARKYGMNRHTLWTRIYKYGWDMERALTTPVNDYRVELELEYDGEKKILTEWARKYGMNPGTLWRRVNGLGWNIEKALTTPLNERLVEIEFNGEKKILSEWRREKGVVRMLYSRWKGMKRRCCDENRDNYKNYGGRGIYVCDEWMDDFQAFFYWCIENGFEKDLQIDRIDNDGPYAPWNCRFVSREENNLNTRKQNPFKICSDTVLDCL